MARRYHLDPLPQGDVPLPAEVAHHLTRVLRSRVGDPLTLFDGRGAEAKATIRSITGRGSGLRVEVAIGPRRTATVVPAISVEIAFPAPKGTRAEWLFEHGTEIGIDVFHPLLTERGHADRRATRWERILVAATGQCDRARLPTLRPARPFAEFLVDPGLPTERYLADPNGPPLSAADTASAVLLVGPEGGLTATETQGALDHRFAPRNLGPLTLRTETAALAGAVLLLQQRCRTG